MDNFYSSLLASLKAIAQTLSLNPIKIYAAYKSALNYQRRFNRYIMQGLTYDETLSLIDRDDAKKIAANISSKENGKPITIAVIGHTYIFNDPYISFDIIRKLRERNVRVWTSDRFTEPQIKQGMSSVEKPPHWSLSRRVLGSAINYSGDPVVDGMIYITPFGCSSDSLIKEYIEANIPHTKRKPIMTLTVDEHSSDAGFITRIEAFLDMLERKKHKRHSDRMGTDTTPKIIDINTILSELSEN
jgi:predicted nucleotide-binding protein (sugar kinase/HSP70/actin superfamily)